MQRTTLGRGARGEDGPGLSRRAVLALLGSAVLPRHALAQAGGPRPPPLCVATPEQTEGPYFVDVRLNRSDIRSDPVSGALKAGVPLALKFNVSAIDTGCVPLQGAMVDIWHCDAAGEYSDAPKAAGRRAHKRGPFLRGYQVTGADGSARFLTIYPGWYPGRAVHIHFKVRTRSVEGRQREFSSQLYFDDALTARIHAHKPYAARRGSATRNEEDGLFRHDDGRKLLLAVDETGQGLAASFDIALRAG